MIFTLNEIIEDLKTARADLLYDIKQDYADVQMNIQLQLLVQAIGCLETIYYMEDTQIFKSTMTRK